MKKLKLNQFYDTHSHRNFPVINTRNSFLTKIKLVKVKRSKVIEIVELIMKYIR